MHENTPWMHLLRGSQSLSFLGIDVPTRDRFVRGDEVGDLYLQVKDRQRKSLTKFYNNTSNNTS
jgi:hypothetical protein